MPTYFKLVILIMLCLIGTPCYEFTFILFILTPQPITKRREYVPLPLKIPRELQKALPYSDKPKITPKAAREQRVIVVKDPKEIEVRGFFFIFIDIENFKLALLFVLPIYSFLHVLLYPILPFSIWFSFLIGTLTLLIYTWFPHSCNIMSSKFVFHKIANKVNPPCMGVARTLRSQKTSHTLVV